VNEEMYARLRSIINLNNITYWTQAARIEPQMPDNETLHLVPTFVDQVEVVGLFEVASFMNHSCVPNVITVPCFHALNKTAFVAHKTIQKGEELQLRYLATPTSNLQRKEELFERFHFWCNCPTCSRVPVTDADSPPRHNKL
jgi:hypothetical protein